MNVRELTMESTRIDVDRLAEVTTGIVAAESADQVLHRTFDRLNDVIPSPIWLALWSGTGGNGAVVCAQNSMSESEARQLVVNAVGRTEPRFGGNLVTPRFVRTYRRSATVAAEEAHGVPGWIDLAVRMPDTAVLFSGFSDAPKPIRERSWPYLFALVNCAAPCLMHACAAGRRGRRRAGQAAGDADALNDALAEHITEAMTHGSDLAFMLIGVSCGDDSNGPEASPPETLTAVAELVITTLRGSDEVFHAPESRLGVIMPYTDPRNALIAADRLLGRLANEQSSGKFPAIGLTMGVTGLDPSARSADALYNCAASALTEAKKASCGAFLYV